MKAVILAGGFGTRLPEETVLRPKPMIEIGGKPLLWHIMKIYSTYDINDFIICCGYKGYMVKEYFSNYFLHNSDVTFDIKNNEMKVHHKFVEPWNVTLVDTGLKTMTGGRLKRIKNFVEDETFCFTYGDGLSDISIKNLIEFHKKQATICTVTSVQAPARFGALKFEKNKITEFQEKPLSDGSWINGGYFVLEPDVFDYIENDDTIWERKPLETLAKESQLSAYKHSGYWNAIDTIWDKNQMEELWKNDQAPWKVW